MGALTTTRSSGKDRILKSLDKLTPSSPVLTCVLATLNDEDVSLGELAGIIETDTVLTGNLLRLVNSPLYGRSETINSVRRAVAIVGRIKIRNLVLGLSVSRRWAGTRLPKQWDRRQFNLHSLKVAALSDRLAQEIAVPYPEGAFVAGLLHDVGELLVATSVPDEYEMISSAQARGLDLSDAENRVLGVTHAELSGAVLERWNLPKPIREAVLYHHAPERADEGRPHLAHIVNAADQYIKAADQYINEQELGAPNYSGHQRIRTEEQERRRPLLNFGLGEHFVPAAETFQREFDMIRHPS